jgi:hypothetical protein
LLFVSFYAGELDHYLNDFSTKSAAVLDLIWKHCEGYPGAAKFNEFCGWVEAHRIRPACAYAANPDLTVLDVDWLRAFHCLYQGLLRDVQDRPEESPARLAQLERDASRIDSPRETLEKRLKAVLGGLKPCWTMFPGNERDDTIRHLWRAFLGPDAKPPSDLFESGAATGPVAAA